MLLLLYLLQPMRGLLYIEHKQDLPTSRR